MIILLDMDEVLVDFVTAACEIHGILRQKMEEYRKPGHWSIVEPLAAALGHELSLDDFWSKIHEAGEDFWTNLKPTPWAADVVSLVEKFSTEWHIVSAPSQETHSYTGKVRWLKNYFGNDFDHFILSPHKYLTAGPDRLLIDDRKANLKKFMYDEHNRPTGGKGVIFPSKGNECHPWADDPLPLLQSCLSSYGYRYLPSVLETF